MKWNINQHLTATEPDKRLAEILRGLLKNRDITTQDEEHNFFNPPLPQQISITDIGVDRKMVDRAIRVIKRTIKSKKKIIVYGDYDADGITATAIMWETLRGLGADVLPYIPDRMTEGYGLNIDSLKELIQLYPDLRLVVTVDQGIVAHEALAFIKSQGVEVVVTDHHQPGESIPDETMVIHTTQTSGSGVAWWFCNELTAGLGKEAPDVADNTLELAAIGTVADLLPLRGINRSLVKHGLEKLRQTKRPGLLAIFSSAGIDAAVVDTYHIGFMIGPRLNAMGRLEHALDSLRLLCTTNPTRAAMLAEKLDQTNRQRQDLTEQTFLHASRVVENQASGNKILIIDHQTYSEGIVGLVAGKLVERFNRPAIVLHRGENLLKASARSIKNFNIIEAIRSVEKLYIRAGGHPMAAGFSVSPENYPVLVEELCKYANARLTDEDLDKRLEVDVQVELRDVTDKLFAEISRFGPFGMGNPEPVFATKAVEIQEAKGVGKKSQHLKFSVRQGKNVFSSIAFNQAAQLSDIQGKKVALAYCLTENVWNGRRSLELRVRDIEIEE